MTLKDLVSDYLAHQRSKGLSPKTAQLTSFALQTFERWWQQAGNRPVTEIDQRTLDAYNVYLLTEHKTPVGKPLARASVRTYVRTLGTAIAWWQKEGELSATVKARQPKAMKKLKEVLSRDEIDRLENAAELERDKLLIRVLADTGMRLSEMLSLRPADLTEVGRERYLKVRGKGGIERLVPVLPSLFTRLRRYAGHRERIFMTVRKSPMTGRFEPLRPRSVENALNYIAMKAGIERSVHPHLFKHSFVCWWLRSHKNPVSLMHIVGWTSLAMLREYEHLLVSDDYAAMLDLHRAS